MVIELCLRHPELEETFQDFLGDYVDIERSEPQSSMALVRQRREELFMTLPQCRQMSSEREQSL